ncbi:unnamed protein product [Prunus armeniaca]
MLFFHFALWHTWKNRCKKVFEDSPSHITLSNPFICKAANDWICANLSSHCKDAKVEVFLAWDFPPVGWWKLNTNGCRKGEEGIICTGGLIRNVNGDWIGGFSANIGIGFVLQGGNIIQGKTKKRKTIIHGSSSEQCPQLVLVVLFV